MPAPMMMTLLAEEVMSMDHCTGCATCPGRSARPCTDDASSVSPPAKAGDPVFVRQGWSPAFAGHDTECVNGRVLSSTPARTGPGRQLIDLHAGRLHERAPAWRL